MMWKLKQGPPVTLVKIKLESVKRERCESAKHPE